MEDLVWIALRQGDPKKWCGSLLASCNILKKGVLIHVSRHFLVQILFACLVMGGPDRNKAELLTDRTADALMQ